MLLGSTFVYWTVAAVGAVVAMNKVAVDNVAVSAGAAGANSPAIERPRGGYPASQRESE
jgi:hypothetical protein